MVWENELQHRCLPRDLITWCIFLYKLYRAPDASSSSGIRHPVRIWDDFDLSALIVYPFSAPEKRPFVLRLLGFSFEIEVGLDGLDVVAKVPPTVLFSKQTRLS